ncbi:MAG: hypothetical protein IPN76_12945 [Saprospiraceae bacterium]|nr:hypothetical protein [Saprospiraceae bacterium]
MTKDIPSALQLLGETYLQLGKWEQGQQQLLRALHLAKAIGMEGQQCKTLLILSQLPLQWVEYPQSIKYLEESLDLAQKLNQRSLLMDIYRILTTAHAKAGNFEAAYRYQTTMKNLEDSLFGFVQKEQIAKFEASFKVKEKELENERLETEKVSKDYIIKKRNSLIISLGVIIIFLLIAAYLFKERAKIKAEYKLRKKSPDIHDDVGSTLNDLKMTIKEALEEKSTDQDKLIRAVQLGNQAMDSLKNLIWNIDKKEVALYQFADEVRALTSDLLSTHQIPFQFDAIGFDAKRPLSQMIYHNLLMIYKEALQNAVKHGDHEQITIDLVYAADVFLLKIKNSCPKLAVND